MELKDALKIIFEKKGRGILKEPMMLKGYLMDIAPEQAKVISVLSQASASHLFDDIAVCEEKDLSVCLNHAVLRMYELYAKKPTDTIKEALTYALSPDQAETEKKAEEQDTVIIKGSIKKDNSSAKRKTKKKLISRKTETGTKKAHKKAGENGDDRPKKKWTPVLLATALVVGILAVFSGMNNRNESIPQSENQPQRSSTETAKTKEPETYNVEVIIGSEENGYVTPYLTELPYYFKLLETENAAYNLNIVYCNNDMYEQIKQVENSISHGGDIIILDLVQTSSADSMIEKVVSAGIPLILINHEPRGDNGDESYAGIIENPTVCFIGVDRRSAGTAQGEIIADLPDHGDLNGDGIISYLMIEGDPENEDAIYRTEFSVKALEDRGLKTKCIDDRVAVWDQVRSEKECYDALNEYGDKIEVVFCNNDTMALGAAAAIAAGNRTVGKDIYLVGIDGLEECIDMVEKGEMTGTVLEDYNLRAHTTADVAVKLINGENIDNYYWIDDLKIVK